MQGTKQFKQDIKAYLDNRAATDGIFKEKYETTTRSIDDVVAYIYDIRYFKGIEKVIMRTNYQL